MNLLSGYVGLICTIAFTCSMICLIQRVWFIVRSMKKENMFISDCRYLPNSGRCI